MALVVEIPLVISVLTAPHKQQVQRVEASALFVRGILWGS